MNKINSCVDWGQLLVCISLKRFLQVVKFLVFLYWEDVIVFVFNHDSDTTTTTTTTFGRKQTEPPLGSTGKKIPAKSDQKSEVWREKGLFFHIIKPLPHWPLQLLLTPKKLNHKCQQQQKFKLRRKKMKMVSFNVAISFHEFLYEYSWNNFFYINYYFNFEFLCSQIFLK